MGTEKSRNYYGDVYKVASLKKIFLNCISTAVRVKVLISLS